MSAAALALALPGVARAQAGLEQSGWKHWWLPDDFSEHGPQIDMLFNWIFWVTMVTLVLVWAVLIVFCVKYRHRPEKRKAVFSHGNTRLEMVWTLVPAVILIVLALVTKRVWDNYRYYPADKRDQLTRVMVIGQQFQWNVIYPGPDGKFGRYLMFPKTTDLKWPQPPPGESYTFPDAPGPAFMPQEQAAVALKNYIEGVNPLGKDFSDPDGADDNWEKQPGRSVTIPQGRTVEVTLSSKDVIHDFFLPNFRVKLDAVPGLRGQVYFTAKTTSKELEAQSKRRYSLDELEKALSAPQPREFTLVIDEKEQHGHIDADATGRRYWKEVDVEKTKMVKGKRTKVIEKGRGTIVRDGFTITRDAVKDLRANNVTEVTAFNPKYWDLVCEELCGSGHSGMQGRVVVVDPIEYSKLGYGPPLVTPPAAPTPPPPGPTIAAAPAAAQPVAAAP